MFCAGFFYSATTCQRHMFWSLGEGGSNGRLAGFPPTCSSIDREIREGHVGAEEPGHLCLAAVPCPVSVRPDIPNARARSVLSGFPVKD